MSAYREGRPQLVHVLEKKLAPHGFEPVAPDAPLVARGIRKLFHRKTWNTNRGVVLVEPGATRLRDVVESSRFEVGAFLGSSWWSQLGLQLVLTFADAPRLPTQEELEEHVDKVNTQGILVQSVFAVDVMTGEWAQGRTWGQMITGKFQDAIQASIQEVVGEH